jgi:hypothetical protein
VRTLWLGSKSEQSDVCLFYLDGNALVITLVTVAPSCSWLITLCPWFFFFHSGIIIYELSLEVCLFGSTPHLTTIVSYLNKCTKAFAFLQNPFLVPVFLFATIEIG